MSIRPTRWPRCCCWSDNDNKKLNHPVLRKCHAAAVVKSTRSWTNPSDRNRSNPMKPKLRHNPDS
eukprot:718413-Prorocentrum_lima.AAC.1